MVVLCHHPVGPVVGKGNHLVLVVRGLDQIARIVIAIQLASMVGIIHFGFALETIENHGLYVIPGIGDLDQVVQGIILVAGDIGFPVVDFMDPDKPLQTVIKELFFAAVFIDNDFLKGQIVGARLAEGAFPVRRIDP